MSDRGLMRREETRFLKAAQRVLLQGGFPNPERTGCPEKSILKAIASREVSPDKVMDWIEHVGMCSPCFLEYTELRKRVVWRRRAAYLSIAAAVIIVILSLGWWRWRSGQPALITGHVQHRRRHEEPADASRRPGARLRSPWSSGADLTTCCSTFLKGARPAIMTSRFSTKSPQSRS